MKDPLEMLTTILLEPYKRLDSMLGLNMDPLMFSYVVSATLSITALVLWILRFRRTAKLVAITAILSILPPLLIEIAYLFKILFGELINSNKI